MAEFRVKYWTNRWGSDSDFKLEYTDDGWIIHAIAHSGPTDPAGKPHLRGNLDQDYVAYPKGIDGYLEHVWRQLNEGEADAEEARVMLNELFAWISNCERSRPLWRGWNC